MAVADEIFAALRGELPEQSFATRFGNQLAQQQFVPRTSSEALWGPLLQGVASGLAQGFGKEQDRSNLFDYYKSNPLIQALAGSAPAASSIGPVADASEYARLLSEAPLAAYQAPSVPSAWKPEQGERDMLTAMLGARQQQEAEAAQAKMQQEIAKEVLKQQALLPVFEQKERIKGSLNPSGTTLKVDTGFSAAAQEELGKSFAVIEEADTVADLLEKSGAGWLDYQLMRRIGAADKEGVGVAIKNLADRLTRARTGAALNKNEEELYSRLVGGDITVDPKQAALLLRKLASSESRYLESRGNFSEMLKTGGIEAMRTKLAEAETARGKALAAASKPNPADYSDFGAYKAALTEWRAAGGS